MDDEHQQHIYQNEVKQYFSGILVDNTGEIQGKGSAGQGDQIEFDDFNQFLGTVRAEASACTSS